jgi:aryl carrier-like protein
MTDHLPPLKGVLHAAGVLDDGLLLQTSWERLENVLRPKVAGAWNLHILTRGLDLDFFVCYSSVAPFLGSPTQGGYAAANAFLDLLAYYRRGLGLPALSVNWGPWEGSGMARDRDENGFWQRMDSYGIGPLPRKVALKRIGELLAAGTVQGGPLAIRWEQFLMHSSDPFFDELAGVPAKREKTLVEACKGKYGSELEIFLLGFLREQLGQVLDVGPETIYPRRALNMLGLDSLMAFELNRRIQEETGLALPLIDLLEGMTLEEMAQKLRNHLEGASVAPSSRQESPASREERVSDPGQLLANLHLFSDDEVALLLKQMQKSV